MMNKAIAGKISGEEHTLYVDILVQIVSDLKWDYYEKYHQEARFIKMPIWVYVLLIQFSRQLIGVDQVVESGEEITKYMGLQICDTMSINEIEDIEVF